MERIEAAEVKTNFDDVLKLVANGKQRILILEAGEERAALVPPEDLALLERLDGDADVPVEHVTARKLSHQFDDELKLVAKGPERIVVQRDKKDIAVLVPRRDLATLEHIDERLDIEAAKRLLRKEMDQD